MGSAEVGGSERQRLGIRRVMGWFLVGALCVESWVKGEEKNRG